MSSAAGSRPKSSPPRNRTRRILLLSVAIIAAIVIGFVAFSSFYTEVLWYQQLGYVSVLLTQWGWGLSMFVVGFLGAGVPVWGALRIAYRSRPLYAEFSSSLSHYQQLIDPIRRFLFWAIPILVGLFGGAIASAGWTTVALAFNGVSTGITDPQFGFDNAFYMFVLPLLRGVASFASTVLLVCLVLEAAVGYLYGGIRFGHRTLRVGKGVRMLLALTIAGYLVVLAVSLWLDRYATLTETNSLMTGANYTSVNAVIPSKTILAIIAALVAALFVVTAFIGRWRLPVIGTAVLLVSALLIGVAYPAVIQRFWVDPSARDLESTYLQRNIDATRAAYGLDDVEVVDYTATTDAEAGQLREDADTTASIRLLDPTIVSPAFRQLQQFKQYYQFDDDLDVDRYEIDGETHDTVIGVRELDVSGLGDSQSWVNDTIVYTHGYGVVAAYGNETDEGLPSFFESDIPSTGELGDYEARVYFGEDSPTYSIVGAPEGSTPVEMDYPAGDDDSSVTYTTYTGDGGPKLDSIFKRLMYAVKFKSEQILLSSYVNDDSQILYDRDPVTRVEKVAPYLTVDSDPYPAVVDGRIVWIVDGYTTSDSYPYSQQESLANAISDTKTDTSSLAVDNINYIRNSVKATVDAYTGEVTLYAWDTDDPVLQTWQKIFPSTLKSYSDMSSELMSHVRYPSDLFKAQRQMLATYHVTDAGAFYSQEDAWQVPTDPTASSTSTTKQPPYYLTMQMPGEDSADFSLYSTYIPINNSTSGNSRSVLTGYLSADSNAGSEAGVKSDSYGKLTLLVLPRESTVPGPGQVQANFNSDQTISSALNLLDQGGSSVVKGNLLTLPVGGGLLYVQPVYVQSSGETSYPILRKVLAAFGDKLAFEDTLDEALDSLFGGDSGAVTGDSGSVSDGSGGSSGDSSSGSGETDSGDSTISSELQQTLEDAKQAMTDRQQALTDGDWTAYGEADSRLQEALEKALELSGASSSDTSTDTSTGSSSESASASESASSDQ